MSQGILRHLPKPVLKSLSIACSLLVAGLCQLCDPTDCSPPGSSGKNPGEGSHSLLQGIFPTQGSNLSLLHCRRILYWLPADCTSKKHHLWSGYLNLSRLKNKQLIFNGISKSQSPLSLFPCSTPWEKTRSESRLKISMW